MLKRTMLILGLPLLLAAAALAAVVLTVRGSLPVLDGEIKLAGLSAPVTVERDAYGVPTIRGSTRNDVARATGFVHAQDRFFQMDLLRRSAAGELAALLGAAGARLDHSRRVHRLRAAAREVMANATARERTLLQAYAEGVNAGLEALSVAPFEYLILRTRPEPWQPEDTVLGNFAMFFQLTDDDAGRESGYAQIHDGLPEGILDFVFAGGNEWDAPLVGSAWEVPPIPDPSLCDLRTGTRALGEAAPPVSVRAEETVNGSNAWVVAGSRTATGRALVANDMHLELRVPNVWYRARLIVEPAAADELPLDLTGVTLPGAPFVVAGSNTQIAWGFTNSRGDWSDLIVLELDPDNPQAYLTPEGYEPFQHYDEVIRVKDADPEAADVRWTRWGPVVGEDHRGRPLALRWLAHVPEGVNLKLFALERAGSVREAVALAPTVGIPPQNFMVADADGSVGWTIMGRIPRRVGYDGRLPTSWADGRNGWRGWLEPQAYPRVIDPAAGFLWTANSRVVEGEALGYLGRDGYSLGARARQIRGALAELPQAEMADMLALQLDDRALLQQRWRDLLLRTLTESAEDANASRAELRRILGDWNGRATIDSVAYRMTREFRRRVHGEILAQIVSGCGEFTRPVRMVGANQAEGPVWRLVSERPAHLLPARYATWDELLLRAADDAVASCRRGRLSECTWGQYNDVEIEHPLVNALEFLEPWLVAHNGPLPGGDHVPRVQQGARGASERFAVAPGDEENGYFHMPAGQSGHPFSPYFLAGHEEWARGRPLPFLPGPAEHTLTLR